MSETLPRVSIVTPSFNQVNFLEQTIRSVLEQNYPNIEYLILDGGSTDGSVEIIRKYQNHLAYWVSQPDNGQAAAINAGWRRSTGEIIAWLNSDDTYEPGAISAVIQVFSMHPDVDVVVGDCAVIDSSGGFLRHLPASDFNLAGILAGNSLPQQGVFLRRAAVEKAGWLDSSLHYVFDWALWLVLGLQGARFYHLATPIANFRVWEQSKTGSGTIGTSLSGGSRFACERRQFLNRIMQSSPFNLTDAQKTWLSAAERNTQLEIILLSLLENHLDKVETLLVDFKMSVPSLRTLSYPQALAQHLAYIEEQKIPVYVHAFLKLMDCFDKPASIAHILLGETYLVKAWFALQCQDKKLAAVYFAKSIFNYPAFLFRRRVISPAIKNLYNLLMGS